MTRGQFDAALRGILSSDPRARVLLLQGASAHLPRWRRTLRAPSSNEDLTDQLIFLPRMPHEQLLALVQVCVGGARVLMTGISLH